MGSETSNGDQVKGFGSDQQPNGVYAPTDDQKKTIEYVYKRFIAMKTSPDREKAEKDWDKWEKQWESYRVPQSESGQEPWMSNHVVPMTTSVVETALSELTRQNLRPFVLPQGPEDQPKAKVMGHIWDFIWRISNGDLTMYGIMKDLLMYGTAIAQEYYLKDRRKVRDTEVDAKGKSSTKEREVFDYDDCMLEQVKLQDFYVDEYARGFDGPYRARDCVRRFVMNIDDFHAMYDDSQWDQFGNAKFVKPGGNTEHTEFFKPPEGSLKDDQVEVLWYWSIKPQDSFKIVANNVDIRDAGNPYKHKQLPYLRAVDIKRIHRFYGKGQPELLESIQNEADTLRRMVIDRNHLDIDKMFFVSNRLGLSDEDLVARPHGMIPTDDVNGAKAVEYGDVPRSVEMSYAHLSDDSIIVTGINPRAQSLPQAGTATEAAILKESTVRRLELKLWLLKKEFMPRLGMLRASNVIQFYSQPRLEQIVGEKGTEQYKAECARLKQQGLLYEENGQDPMKMSYRSIPIKGKQLSFDATNKMTETKASGFTFFELTPNTFTPQRGQFWFQFESGSNLDVSKPLLQQKDLELFDRFSQIALTVPNSYDIVKLGDMILEDFNKNPDDFKIDQQPVMSDDAQRTQMLAQLAQMENQQMMAGQDIPATPYADKSHTLLHIYYMKGKQFMALPNNSPIVKVFTTHVTGEIMAQEARNMNGATQPDPNQPQEQAQPKPGEQPPPPPSVSVSIRADASTPEGQKLLQDVGVEPAGPPPPPTPGGAANGITNKKGGMAKPQASMQDVMPDMKVGGNMSKK